MQMDRQKARSRGISSACIVAVEQAARCKEDAMDVLDQCDGMQDYLTPEIVMAIALRYYLQREADRARSDEMQHYNETLSQGRPTKAVKAARLKRERVKVPTPSSIYTLLNSHFPT